MKFFSRLPKRLSWLLVVTLLITICHNISAQVDTVKISFQGSARGTAYGMQNKVVSVRRNGIIYSYFAYVDTTGSYSTIDCYNSVCPKKFAVKIRELNTKTNVKSNPVIVGYIWEPIVDTYNPITFLEPHGSPSITLDKDSYLHVVWGRHYTSLFYKKSLNALNQYGLSFPVNPEVIQGTKSDSTDHWTYPIIKADQNGTLHVVGSLDSDGNSGNDAREIGYAQKEINHQWVYPERMTNDPINVYSPLFQCRYDLMMNIDRNNNIHILAPDQSSYTGSPNLGYLDYWHFKSSDGKSFAGPSDKAYSNDGNMYESGLGNMAFDRDGNPHFLVYYTDETITNPCSTKFVKHVYFNSTSNAWNSDDIKIEHQVYSDIQLAKIRIDDDGEIFIVLQASLKYAPCSNSASDPSAIYIARKSLNKNESTFEVKRVRDGYEDQQNGLLWYPSIEEDENYTVNKNWFYLFWQHAHDRTANQMLEAAKVIPCNAYIKDRTFSNYSEYLTGESIKIESFQDANSINYNKGVIFQSSSETSLNAASSISLKNCTIKKGSSFHASIDNTLSCYVSDYNAFVARAKTNRIHPEPVKNIDAPSIDVYPNPNNGSFTIKVADAAFSSLAIYDVMGRAVFSTEKQQNTIEITNLQVQGMYLLKVSYSSGSHLKRIVVK